MINELSLRIVESAVVRWRAGVFTAFGCDDLRKSDEGEPESQSVNSGHEQLGFPDKNCPAGGPHYAYPDATARNGVRFYYQQCE